jgi:pyridinium-3,5-biscarboxylic acid mononucleotide sulfurtransferase
MCASTEANSRRMCWHKLPRLLRREPCHDWVAMSELSERLIAAIREIGPVVVAFSGGVDSAVVAAAAVRALPADQVLAVTADSESLAVGELDTCRRLTKEWGVAWRAAQTHEMADPRYIANSGDRCYWCKSALMDQLEPIASERGATVVLGVNVDDLGDHRPGQQAAAERGAQFPLVIAGITKADVRAIALEWGLEVWDRPSMPCLSSRIPYGTPVSITLLSRIDRAEKAVRELGFRDVRVRDYGDTARIELPHDDLPRAAVIAAQLHDLVTACGYRYVTLDLAGLRSGNLNAALAGAAATHG